MKNKKESPKAKSQLKSPKSVVVGKRKPVQYILVGKRSVGRTHSVANLLKNSKTKVKVIDFPKDKPSELFAKKAKAIGTGKPLVEPNKKNAIIGKPKEQTDEEFTKIITEQIRICVKNSSKNDFAHVYTLMGDRFKLMTKILLREHIGLKVKLGTMQNMDKSNPARKGKYGKYFHTMPELKKQIKKIEIKLKLVEVAKAFCAKMVLVCRYTPILKSK